MILGVYQVHPWRQGGPCSTSILSGTLKVCQEPSKVPPLLDTLLIMILSQNFQDMIPGVYQVHPWHQGGPGSSSILLETLNILQVPP